MPDDISSEAVSASRRASLLAIGPITFAVGGAAAAFGAASCCAIPVLLGGIGLGGLGSALFMPVLVPFQSYLLAAALGCLAASGVLLWRRQSCARRGARTASMITLIGLALGTALLALGFVYG